MAITNDDQAPCRGWADLRQLLLEVGFKLARYHKKLLNMTKNALLFCQGRVDRSGLSPGFSWASLGKIPQLSNMTTTALAE